MHASAHIPLHATGSLHVDAQVRAFSHRFLHENTGEATSRRVFITVNAHCRDVTVTRWCR